MYIVRGLDDNGEGYESDIYEAMEQCELSDAKVISLSLGGSAMSDTFGEILERLYNRGFLIYGAAGNNGSMERNYPGSHPDVVSVAAVTEDGVYWPSSNYGPWVECGAPGDQILSTAIDKESGAYTYAIYSGTSMATPHAAGAAALVWSHFPHCTNQQIRYAMAYTAKDIGDTGCDDDSGYGIPQVKLAYNFLREYPCTNTTNWGQRRNHTGECSIVNVQPVNVRNDTTTGNSGAMVAGNGMSLSGDTLTMLGSANPFASINFSGQNISASSVNSWSQLSIP
jgi:serine protease